MDRKLILSQWRTPQKKTQVLDLLSLGPIGLVLTSSLTKYCGIFSSRSIEAIEKSNDLKESNDINTHLDANIRSCLKNKHMENAFDRYTSHSKVLTALSFLQHAQYTVFVFFRILVYKSKYSGYCYSILYT
jgi:hypothetical protein